MNWLNTCCREILDGWKEEDRQAEALYFGHLRQHNPEWMDDIHNRAMVGIALQMVAVVTFLAFMGWLAFFRSMV